MKYLSEEDYKNVLINFSYQGIPHSLERAYKHRDGFQLWISHVDTNKCSYSHLDLDCTYKDYSLFVEALQLCNIEMDKLLIYNSRLIKELLSQ